MADNLLVSENVLGMISANSGGESTLASAYRPSNTRQDLLDLAHVLRDRGHNPSWLCERLADRGRELPASILISLQNLSELLDASPDIKLLEQTPAAHIIRIRFYPWTRENGFNEIEVPIAADTSEAEFLQRVTEMAKQVWDMTVASGRKGSLPPRRRPHYATRDRAGWFIDELEGVARNQIGLAQERDQQTVDRGIAAIMKLLSEKE